MHRFLARGDVCFGCLGCRRLHVAILAGYRSRRGEHFVSLPGDFCKIAGSDELLQCRLRLPELALRLGNGSLAWDTC